MAWASVVVKGIQSRWNITFPTRSRIQIGGTTCDHRNSWSHGESEGSGYSRLEMDFYQTTPPPVEGFSLPDREPLLLLSGLTQFRRFERGCPLKEVLCRGGEVGEALVCGDLL